MKSQASLVLKAALFLIVAELMLPPVPYRLAMAAPTKAPLMPLAPLAPKAQAPKARLSPEVVSAIAVPLVETLQNMGEIPFTMGIGANDPALDADPFFLRSQSWSKASVKFDGATDGIAFRRDGQRLDIGLAGQSNVWSLNANLRPAYADDTWVYLVADDETIFETKSPGEAVPGQGIFLVSVAELRAASVDRQTSPVYFLPLPGGEWTGKVEFNAVPHTDTVLITDHEGDTLPFLYKDIEKVIFGQKLNLLLALGAATRSAVLTKTGNIGAVLPLAGSTAGFGMLFTGLDLKNPDLNLFDGVTVSSSLFRAVPGLQKFWSQIVSPVAHADDNPNTKLIKNLIRVAVVTGIALTAAVLMKYTLYRDHFKKKAAAEPIPTTFWGRLGRQARDIGDVFAHNLTFLSTVATNWFGNSVEYLIDRHFPKLGAGKNTLVRRFLNQTVYQARDMTENIPVNWNTAMLGIGPLGFTDSALVAVQLYFVVPWIAQGIAEAVPSWKEKVDAAFDVNNPQTEIYNRNEVIRNLAAYITSGASSVSADLKGQLITVLGPEVDTELRKLGLDPNSPSVKPIRDAKIEEMFSKVAKQVGLPGKEDFLFDASTIWAYGQQLMGNKLANGLVPDAMAAANFLGEKRPGAILPAVKAALKEAKKRLKADPADTSLINAVKVLEQTVADLSIVWNYVQFPLKWIVGKLTGSSPPGWKDVAASYRRARQNLIALTYDGPMSESLKFLPGSWLEAFKIDGVEVAGTLFRRSYYSVLSGDQDAFLGPNREQYAATEALHAGFEKAALTTLSARYANEYQAKVTAANGDAAQALRELRHAHRAEFQLLMDEKIHSRALADIDAAIPYAPAKQSWFGRLQVRRAKAEADRVFTLTHGRTFSPESATPDETKSWTYDYTKALMNAVSLYPDYDAIEGLREKIDEKVDELDKAQLNDPKLKIFLADMNADDKLTFVANLHAENMIQAYRDIVPNLVDEEAQKHYVAEFGHAFNPLQATKVEKKAFKRHYAKAALSTAQPGRYQWVRQLRWVRESRFWTRMIRTVESFFPTEAHKTGLISAMFRNVPTMYDTWIGNLRSYRAAITSATAVYWFNYMIWGVALPLPLWILALMTRFTVASPAQWMTRLFRMQGLQAMGGVKDMTFFAFLYSWVTFWGSIPTLLFADDFKQLIEAIEKVVGAQAAVVSDKAEAVVEACSTLIGQAKK